jgi:hypothetical protein
MLPIRLDKAFHKITDRATNGGARPTVARWRLNGRRAMIRAMLAGFFRSTVAAVLLLLLVACAEDLMSPGAADQVSDRVHTMARDGDPTAQTALGVIFERGLGVPRDTAKARIWYDRAARQGDPLAEYHIGSLYERGVGVDQDYGEAARWYRRAAEKQHDAAQAALAYLYERGLGVDQDYGRARALYAAAARRWQAEAVFPPEATFALGRERPTTRFSRRSARTQGEEEAVTTDWPPPPPVEVDLAAIADAPAPARAARGDFDGPAPIAGTGEAFPLGINATSAAPIRGTAGDIAGDAASGEPPPTGRSAAFGIGTGRTLRRTDLRFSSGT